MTCTAACHWGGNQEALASLLGRPEVVHFYLQSMILTQTLYHELATITWILQHDLMLRKAGVLSPLLTPTLVSLLGSERVPFWG